MSIEFIRDEFLEGKKEELDNIERELSHKPKKTDRNVLFLRRFTLALMGQYKIQNKHLEIKHDEIEMLNRRIMLETHKINQFKRPIQRLMPQPPLGIPTPSGLNVPIPQQPQAPRPQLQVPAPIKEELKIPKPIIVENLPKENIQAKQEKKEFNIPNPL